MKKIIVLCVLLISLSGCTTKIYTPVLNTDFASDAVYKTGDFSYACHIERSGGAVCVKVLSTQAAGLQMCSDGKTVTYSYESAEQSYPCEQIDKSNPAVLLYEVFDVLEQEQVQATLEQDLFQYGGTCAFGKFILCQNKQNQFLTLSVPAADIEIFFREKELFEKLIKDSDK